MYTNTATDNIPAGMDTDTKTVKLSRGKIGMVPKVSDSFNVNVVETHASLEATKPPFAPQPPAQAAPHEAAQAQQQAQTQSKKWWGGIKK